MTLSDARIPFVQNAPYLPDHAAVRDAWVGAARGRNRRAVQYRKWAEEADQAGNLDAYRHYSNLSRKSRMRALDALSYARLEASYCD